MFGSMLFKWYRNFCTLSAARKSCAGVIDVYTFSNHSDQWCEVLLLVFVVHALAFRNEYSCKIASQCRPHCCVNIEYSFIFTQIAIAVIQGAIVIEAMFVYIYIKSTFCRQENTEVSQCIHRPSVLWHRILSVYSMNIHVRRLSLQPNGIGCLYILMIFSCSYIHAPRLSGTC